MPEPSKPEDESKVQHLSLCITASDFEAEAMKVLDRRARVYITSSANSGLSLRGNLDDWSRVGFRPRVMRDVASVDTGAAALGHPARLPFFACPMGTMGMAHPDGELALVRGLARGGVHGVASTASSKPAGRIMEAFAAEHAALGGASPSRLFFQLYVPADRARALALVRKARAAGYAGLWVTVDTPVIGKRTADRRKQAEEALAAGAADQKPGTAAAQASAENAFAPAVGARPVPGSISPGVSWEDLEWIRGAWGGPIVLKGIQCAEDAKLAAENDCQGILLSNHGGRQQHTAPSALMTLLEIRAYCPEVLDKLEVYVDGGCRDGADVLKALCLGATAVGLGRPFFYALAAYGTAGVERCIDSESSSALRHPWRGSWIHARDVLTRFSHFGGAGNRNEATRRYVFGPAPARDGKHQPSVERYVEARDTFDSKPFVRRSRRIVSGAPRHPIIRK